MSFWKFTNKTEKRGELYLFGEISSSSWWGDEITPKQFLQDLKALGDITELDIHINSGGGDVFAANTICNILKQHSSTKSIYVEGLCASAAMTFPMLGKVYTAKNAFFMIHNPKTWGGGESSEFRKIADFLDKLKDVMISTYQEKTTLSKEELEKMMDEETWMSGEEAVNYGFADEISNDVKVSACINEGNVVFNGVPVDFTGYKNAPKIMSYHLEEPEKNIKKVPKPSNKTILLMKEVEILEIGG